MGETTISVVISTYNYGHYIAHALDSLLDQTYPDWECLVIDDGSTDDTREVVAEYAKRDARIRYRHQANQGQSVGLNNGIRETTGRYIQILDADDILPREKFARQVAYLDAHREAGVIYGPFSFFRDTGRDKLPDWKTIETVNPPVCNSDDEALTALIRHNFLAINAPLFRRSVFDEVGGFDEDRDAIADWYFWITCARKKAGFRCVADEKTSPFVRVHSDSRSADRTKFHARMVKLRRKIEETFDDREILRLNRILWGELEGYRGIYELGSGKTTTGIRRLTRAARISPGLKSKARWLYCLAIWPLAPQQSYEKAATAPFRQSLISFLRSDRGMD